MLSVVVAAPGKLPWDSVVVVLQVAEEIMVAEEILVAEETLVAEGILEAFQDDRTSVEVLVVTANEGRVPGVDELTFSVTVVDAPSVESGVALVTGPVDGDDMMMVTFVFVVVILRNGQLLNLTSDVASLYRERLLEKVGVILSVSKQGEGS